ncbi:MAG: DoxX family protein, partial [Bdellovibrionota bacterium]
IARVFIGVCFIVHALGKLGIVGPGNMAGFAGWLKSLGVPFPELQARMAMLAELGGGTMIALGLFTRVGCVLCFSTMLVAMTLGHKGGGYLITNNPPGAEYTINLAAICLVLFLLGPGAYSLDMLIFG